MPRIKVLHIFKSYLPRVGGVERVIQQIAEGLAPKGVESRVLACHHNRSFSSTEEVIGGIHVTRANSIGVLFSTPISPAFPLAFRRLSQWADILHFHSPFPLAELSHLMYGSRGKKVVVTYHADISQTRWRVLMLVHKPILRRLLEKASCIITTSPAALEFSTVLSPFSSKCRVIPLAIDLAKWRPVPAEKVTKLKERFGLEDEKVILFVGRLIYYKGLDYLIAAMQRVNAKLVIVGEGEYKNELKQKVNKLRLANKVTFAGKVPDEELPSYYSMADVFVLPSIYGAEAFGIVQLEAMAYGVPIVNTNLPTGVTFVSPHNETGLTVPPRDSKALANAINTILEDDSLRQRLSRNARDRAKLFSLDRMLEEVYNLYTEVLNKM